MQHEYIINGVTFTEEQLRKEAEENNVPYEEYLSSLTSITQKEKELTFNDLTYSQKQNYFRNFSQDTSQEDYLNQIKAGLNVEARDIENNFLKAIDLTSDEIEVVKTQVGEDYFKIDKLDDRNATVRSTYITPSGSTRQSGALENKYKTDEEYDEYLQNYYGTDYDDYKKFIDSLNDSKKNIILPNSNKVKDDYEKYAQQLKLKKAEIQVRDIDPQVKPFINAFRAVGFENEEQATTYLNDTYNWFEKELLRFDEIEANLNKEETSYMSSLQNIKNKIDKVKGDASVLPKVNRDMLNSYINEYNTIVNKINEAGLEDQINSLNQSKKAFNFKVNDFKNKSKKISNASILATALNKDYGWFTRTGQVLLETLGGLSSLTAMSLEVANDISKFFKQVGGPGDYRPTLPNVTDLEDGVLDDLVEVSKNYSIDFNQKINERRETKIPINLTYEDVEAGSVSFGQFALEALANNSPSIAIGSIGGIGGVALRGVSKAAGRSAMKKILDVQTGLFFGLEGGDAASNMYLKKNNAPKAIKYYEGILSKEDSTELDKEHARVELDRLNNFMDVNLVGHALNVYGKGLVATYAERLGGTRFINNLAYNTPKSFKTVLRGESYKNKLKFAGNLFYRGLAIPTVNFTKAAGIELSEEAITEGAHNILDQQVYREDKKITDGIDKNFVANTLITLGPIIGPSQASNFTSSINQMFTDRRTVLKNVDTAKKLEDLYSQLRTNYGTYSGKLNAQRNKIQSEIFKLTKDLALADRKEFTKMKDLTASEIEQVIDLRRQEENINQTILNVGVEEGATKKAQDLVDGLVKDKNKIIKDLERILDGPVKKLNTTFKQDVRFIAGSVDDEDFSDDMFYQLGILQHSKNVAELLLPVGGKIIDVNSNNVSQKLEEAGYDINNADIKDIISKVRANQAIASTTNNDIIINTPLAHHSIYRGDYNATVAPLEELFHIHLKNIGVSDALQNNKQIEDAIKDLEKILEQKNKEGILQDDEYNVLKARVGLYGKDKNSNEETIAQINNLILRGVLNVNDIKGSYGVQKYVRDLVGNVMGDAAWLYDYSAEGIVDLLRSYKGKISSESQVISGSPEESGEAKYQMSVLQSIDNLIPKSINTKSDYDNFIRDEAQAKKLFDAIYNDDGVINRYIKSKSITAEESQRTRDLVVDRIFNFNPEAVRQTGEQVGSEGFGEAIFANTKWARITARTELATRPDIASEDVSDVKGAKQIADESFNINNDLKSIDNTYTDLLESKIFDEATINSISNKVKRELAVTDLQIYEAVSQNKTVTPFVSQIRNAIKKQADIDVRKAMGGIKDNQFATFLIRNKKAILENMTTSFLSRFAPQTIEKQVDGVFTSNWQGKKIDRASAKETGMTSGPQIMRRKNNVEESITDAEWLDIFIKNNKIVAAKKESLAQQIAAEIGLDLLRNDLLTDGPISQSLTKNAEAKQIVLKDNYVAEIGRQLDRGNVKFQKALFVPDVYLNNSNQYVKDFNKISKLIYDNHLTVESVVAGDEWKDSSLKQFDTAFIEHFRELERKGVYASTGFKNAMVRTGVDKAIIDNFNQSGYDKDKLDKDNLVIAQSGLGKVIYNLYKKPDGEVAADIPMLLYMYRELRSSEKQVDEVATLKRKQKVAKALNITLEELSKRKEGKGLVVYQTDADGNFIPAQFYEGKIDVANALKNNDVEVPAEVEQALKDFKVYNSKKGFMYDLMKDIYSVDGVENQLKILKKYEAQIADINSANKTLLKFTLSQLRDLVRTEKIETNSALKILQGQTNAVLGIKGLTTLEYLTIDGKKRNAEELKKLYGEHLKVNVQAMADMAKVITTAADVNIDDFVDFELQEYTQLASFSNIASNIDTIGKTNFTTSVERINTLDPKDINDIYSFTGEKFRIYRANQVAENTARQFELKKELELSKIYDQAAESARDFEAENKGITILDFDDTVAISDSKVIVNMPDGTTTKITPAEFALNSSDLENKGATFNFEEFNKVIRGRKGPLFDLALKRQKKFGSKDIFILTARPQASALSIQKFAKGLGLNIPLKNITGLEDGTPKAKADWVVGKVAEGYNDFYFADDAYKNVKAVQQVLDVADVKSDVRQAQKSKFQRSLFSQEFNVILEQTKGIGAEKIFSDAAAKARGGRAGKWNIFIPPSAEDLAGLLYQFMGKGKVGDDHKKFFERTILRPLARGINSLNAAKQALRNDHEALKKQYPDIVKVLKSDSGYNMFTFDQAIRAYIWTKNGVDVPGLSKTDARNLTRIVKANDNMRQYADKISEITKLDTGLPTPTEDWIASSIGLEIIKVNQEVRRGDYLQEFNKNSAEIFSAENMNKIQAVYGDNFREALEDILYRVQVGSNRNFGDNRLVNGFMDWLNSATGTIMFFNTRSAVLQTISFANFVNWTDNNIVAAGAAFANQGQFWKDFGTLFNSDFLRQRRGGMTQDVNWQEISDSITGSKDPVRRAISLLLQKGFLPTQIADSFAIALGGSSMYRNRIKTYKKQGLDQQAAEEKAFLDFQEIAETTQQSGRPDVVSQQQASPLGRVILAFQNVTMQYNRLAKKSMLDLYNRRKAPGQNQFNSDLTNVSKITYYMFAQNLLFNSMQQALFAMLFNDETPDEEKQRMEGIVNGMADSVLRGMGISGAVVATLKNMAMEFNKQSGKPSNRADYAYVLLDGINLSPPLGSKANKVYRALQTYKFNREEIKEKGFSIDNPALEASANLISAGTNIPTDRLYYKIESIGQMLDAETRAWQRVALALGWRDWQLGVGSEEELKKLEAIKIQPMKVGGIKIKPFKIK